MGCNAGLWDGLCERTHVELWTFIVTMSLSTHVMLNQQDFVALGKTLVDAQSCAS